MATLLFAVGYYRWGGWRTARLIDTVPHGETPDPGQGPSTGIEETEVQAEAVESLRERPVGAG
jgi:hypothetical protein